MELWNRVCGTASVGGIKKRKFKLSKTVEVGHVIIFSSTFFTLDSIPLFTHLFP
jgi:hypothetical protein